MLVCAKVSRVFCYHSFTLIARPIQENLFSIYIGRVKQNLHVVLCMSPIGDAFRNRLRMFPSLVNCCTIDWYSMWPEEALRSVAASFIAEMSEIGSETVVGAVIDQCVRIHESVRAKCAKYKSSLNRHNYVTPKSYLELLLLFRRLLDGKKQELLGLRKRTATGLEKLLAVCGKGSGGKDISGDSRSFLHYMLIRPRKKWNCYRRN